MIINYVQLEDVTNKVIGVSQLKGEVNAPNMIQINEYDRRLLITYYSNGVFEGYYIIMTSDKLNILADGTDIATITVTIYNYLDQLATNFITNIIFEIDGTQKTVTPVDGKASITFNTSVAGTFVIKTVNDEVLNKIENYQIEVIAE
jgi:hypothetical protein